MRRIFPVALILVWIAITVAREMPDLIAFSDGQVSYVFLTRPIPRGQGVELWKKVGAGEWQKALPVVVRAIDDPYELQKMLGADYQVLARTMKDPDPGRILTKLQVDPVYSLMLCFKLPRLSVLLGRLLIDPRIRQGERIQYYVAFVDGNNKEVRKTDPVTVVVRKPAVREVTDLKVEIQDRMAKITFTYPQFNWDQPDWVVGFRLYRSVDGAHYIRVGDDFIYRLDNPLVELQDGLLDYGKTYWYKVTTISYFGYESPGSSPVKVYVKDMEPPAIVRNVRAEYNGKGILVSWDLSPEPDVLGYDVYRGTKMEEVKEKLNKAIIPALQTFYFDSTGMQGEKYFYGVVAVDKEGNRSKMSALPYAVWVDNTPPPPPDTVLAEYRNGKIRIKWQPVTTEKLRGYYVYRGEDREHMLQLTPKPVGAENPVFADSGYGDKKFKYGEKYWVAVRAVDMAWNLSDFTYTRVLVPDTIPPEPPADVVLDIRENGDVHVSWNPSPSPDVVAYEVLLTPEGQTEPVIHRQVRADTLRGYFQQLPKGQNFILRIGSVDKAGNRSLKYLEQRIEVRDYTPPPHPRNVFVEKTEKGYRITWNKVVDFDLVGYRIYRANSPMSQYELAVPEVIKAEEFLLPLTAPKGYYQIRALDTSGNESKGNEIVYVGK